jgi:hypothetical protein
MNAANGVQTLPRPNGNVLVLEAGVSGAMVIVAALAGATLSASSASDVASNAIPLLTMWRAYIRSDPAGKADFR